MEFPMHVYQFSIKPDGSSLISRRKKWLIDNLAEHRLPWITKPCFLVLASYLGQKHWSSYSNCLGLTFTELPCVCLDNRRTIIRGSDVTEYIFHSGFECCTQTPTKLSFISKARFKKRRSFHEPNFLMIIKFELDQRWSGLDSGDELLAVL